MNSAVFFLLFCACAYSVNSTIITKYGNTDGVRTDDLALTLGPIQKFAVPLLTRTDKVTWTSYVCDHQTNSTHVISGIVHVDGNEEGNGVHAEIANGGIGCPYVIYNLASQRNHGINSTFYLNVIPWSQNTIICPTFH